MPPSFYVNTLSLSRRNQQQLFQSCSSSSADTFIASPRPLLAGLGSKDLDSRGAGQGITWGSGLLGGAGWPDKGSLLSTRGCNCVPCVATPLPGAFGFVNDISRDRLSCSTEERDDWGPRRWIKLEGQSLSLFPRCWWGKVGQHQWQAVPVWVNGSSGDKVYFWIL